ncbi:hypothetical protein VS884_25590, partial [Escherichia coli]
REIACRLWNMGWPPERIQEVTGLSGEELKKLFPRTSQPGKMPGFFVSRSRANSMTIAERL